MADGVKRIPIDEDGVVGTVFLPPKHLDRETLEWPRPLIVNAYGGIHRGGLIEEKAALMASRGMEMKKQELWDRYYLDIFSEYWKILILNFNNCALLKSSSTIIVNYNYFLLH